MNEARQTVAKFSRWLAHHRVELSPEAERAAEDVRAVLTMLANGGAASAALRTSAAAKIEALCGHLGVVQRAHDKSVRGL